MCADVVKEPTDSWYVWACIAMRFTNVLTFWLILLAIAWLLYG
jgi:hypothetical protein